MATSVVQTPAGEVTLHIEERDGQWYGCVSGTNADGLEFESDDEGPFATAQDAEDALRAYLADYHQAEPAADEESRPFRA